MITERILTITQMCSQFVQHGSVGAGVVHPVDKPQARILSEPPLRLVQRLCVIHRGQVMKAGHCMIDVPGFGRVHERVGI